MATVWATTTEIIFEYTGLSATAFFTIVVMMLVTYKVVCSMFLSADDFVPVKKQSLNLGDMTEEELRAYNGSDSEKPLLMAIRGQIYDVSTSKKKWGGGIMGSKSQGRTKAKERVLAKEAAQRLN
ncbi:hypothetical protein MTR67_019064 [Solanum verrucosum]|uniref:Cytochrome b5 heme-binding domain-containing protein n=1 Tax=Solanum verrucosum TaxID=315347 RepID=A0AAF0QKU4_SOLVR|nr:hypothetical protein MTR67_019064 [Solanum verrucosum]